MMASRGLDAEVAHRVMGWRVTAMNTSPHDGGSNEIRGLANSRIGGGCVIEHPEWMTSYYVSDRCEVPAYSTDIAAAWLVVGKLLQEWIVGLEIDQSWASVHLGKNYASDPVELTASAKTAPLAICLAALKVAGMEV